MQTLHQNIQEWYQAYGRQELPWRNTKEPYHIYLSEVMLQQTQVKTVLERYYFPFIEAFPTLQALANAHLDEVLKRWEGLGYYNRAKNLHKTANLCPNGLPQTIEELIKLPGIGNNTAHALATFAFKQPVPIMEANVKRILCRVHAIQTPKEKELWQHAYTLLDKDNSFDYNQAMMDIGSMVCTPKNPSCGLCPLKTICQGKTEPERYPEKKVKKTPTKTEHILIYSHKNTLSLYQREGKFLHGLWGFHTTTTLPTLADYIGEVKHAYTHFKLICKVHLLQESSPTKKHYFTPQKIEKLAISKIDEKILNLYLDTMQI
jgi:A/G-specific adenine glycosylase